METPKPLRSIAFLALVAAGPVAGNAQAPADSTVQPTTRVWLSAGVGPADMRMAPGASLRGSVSASRGIAVLIVRRTLSLEGIDGHTDHSEQSILAGPRLGSKYIYAVPALGVGTAHWHNDLCTAHIICTPEVAAQYDDKGAVLAYDIGVHADRLVAGLAASFMGVVGGYKRNLFAVVLSLEAGWFDK